MNIGIDIDDCLAAYMPVFLNRVDRYYNIKIPVNALNKFSAKTEDYGFITVDQAKRLLNLENKDRVLLQLPTHQGAVKGVNNLAADNNIVLVTSRNNYDLKLLRQHTFLWLKKYGFIFHHIEFTQTKGETAEKLGINVFIEDSLKFAQQLTSSGIRVILYAQPWNKNYNQYLGKKLSKLIIGRTNNWDEIVDIVKRGSKESGAREVAV